MSGAKDVQGDVQGEGSVRGAGGARSTQGARGAEDAEGAGGAREQGTQGGTGGAPGGAEEPDRAALLDMLPLGGPGLRGVLYAGLAVLGALVGTAGALAQAGWFPLGLLLALAAAVGVFWGGTKLCRTKSGAMAPGAGWFAAVVLLTTARPEGDFLFGAGAGSYVFLLGGMFAAVMCATIALPAPPVPGHKYR